MMWVETETVIELQSGIVAIEAYLQFERAVFVLKIYFHFRLLQLGDVLTNRGSDTNLALPTGDVKVM